MEVSVSAKERARKAFQAADGVWSYILAQTFGTRAGDVRYTKEGEGAPDSLLRLAHDSFHAAREAWDAATKEAIK